MDQKVDVENIELNEKDSADIEHPDEAEGGSPGRQLQVSILDDQGFSRNSDLSAQRHQNHLK